MNADVKPAAEAEETRRQLAAELAADHGPGWAEPFRPGTFGGHELLDRVSLFAGWLERDLVSHPACVANPEWFALAERAAEALRELYQRVGEEHV